MGLVLTYNIECDSIKIILKINEMEGGMLKWEKEK